MKDIKNESMKQLLFVVLILSSFLGCGGQDVNFDPRQKINLDTNITASVNYLKREYADLYITTYVADNEQDFFVYAKEKNQYGAYSPSLYHYRAITSWKPKFINTVVELSSLDVKGFHFLPENKIIYVRASALRPDVLVCIYDYKQVKEIRRYENLLRGSFNLDIELSQDGCSFFAYNDNESVQVDIQDIYKEYRCNGNVLERD